MALRTPRGTVKIICPKCGATVNTRAYTIVKGAQVLCLSCNQWVRVDLAEQEK